MNYLVCIGSNEGREEHMSLARHELTARFDQVRFSAELETEPLDMSHSGQFTNQLVRFVSDASPQDVNRQLKEIERLAGRCPEDKAHEVVKLDLDLLMVDEKVMRNDDLERDFVKQLWFK